jgi:tetratricopeptide (TPR) repeat protein
MALRPEDRYATPRALAAEIEHWLADERVAAYAEPWSTKARRWLGRHRILATSSAAALVVATLILSVATALLQAANQREQLSLARAEANFELARNAVDRYFTKVSESPRLKAHDLEGLRKELLQQARDFYEQFIREQGASPALQVGLWVAYDRLGKISVEIGSREEALEYFRRAQQTAEQLVSQGRGRVENQRALAASIHNQAWIYALEKKGDQARALFESALQIIREAVAQDSNDSRNPDELARILNDLGVLYQQTGHLEDARAAFLAALPICEQLASKHAGDPAYLQSWIRCYYVLGRLERTLGADAARALPYFQRARSLAEELVKQHPDQPGYQAELANVLCELGATQHGVLGAQQARASFLAALPIWTRLSERHPDVPGYEESRVTNLSDIAQLHRLDGEYDLATKVFSEALLAAKRLAQRQDADPELRRVVGMISNNLGELHLATGRWEAARGSFEEALEICDRLVREHELYVSFRTELNTAQIGLARARARQGDHEAALRGIEPALKDVHLSAAHVYDVGCAFALASAAAAHDARLTPAERLRLGEQHAARGVEWLKRAFSNGYHDLANLKKDTELASLRARGDFKKLVNKLEAAADERDRLPG